MRALFLNQKGNILIFFVVLLGVLVALAGVALDIGLVSAQKSILQNAVDSAVLAGANKLPVSAEEAVAIARDYASKNNVTAAEITKMQVRDTDPNILDGAASRHVPSIFGKIVGFEEGYTVSVKASAKVWPLGSGVGGVVPFGVNYEFFKNAIIGGDLYSQEVTLHYGGGDGVQGDYGAVRLGDSKGANDYAQNILCGFDKPISIGDTVYVESGVMSGKTYESVTQRIATEPYCVVPIVQIKTEGTTGSNGQKVSSFTVVGFAMFQLLRVDGQGGDNNVYGVFVKEVYPGDITTDPSKDFGVYSTHAALIQ
jgi:hypothetical protein